MMDSVAVRVDVGSNKLIFSLENIQAESVDSALPGSNKTRSE